MSQTLENIAAKFGNSEPVFKAERRHSTDIRFFVADQYEPGIAGIEDPVEIQVAGSYYENFNWDLKKFEKSINLQSVYNKIMRHLISVYEKYSGLKNPQQSKLYKWLRAIDNEYNHPFVEGFIALYRYSQTSNKLEPFKNEDDPHVRNILAILNKVKEKYEKR